MPRRRLSRGAARLVACAAFAGLHVAARADAPADNLIWNQVGGTWDTNLANQPWINTGSSGTTSFASGDIANFTSTAVGAVNIDASGVSPSTTSISNTNGVYTFNGGGILAGSLTKSNNGAAVFANGANSFTGIAVNGGTLTFGGTAGATIPLNVPSVSVADGAMLSFSPQTVTQTVTNTIASLNLNNAGVLDLGNHSLLTSTPVSTIQQYLQAGYNGGAWNGSVGARILSSTAGQFSGTDGRSLGYASPGDGVARGVNIPSGQTLVKYTSPGDLNLSGKTDFIDFMAMQNNWNKSGNWSKGDVNYDGVVNFDDFLVLQGVYNNGLNATGAVHSVRPRALAATPAASSPVPSLATPATAFPSVTYVLSKNDDGRGNFSPGNFAVYAIDSTTDGNHGIASYTVDVVGFASITNFSPRGAYDDGTGSGETVSEGFTLLRTATGAIGTQTDPVRGSQSTIGDFPVKLIYGMGQIAGNLNTQKPAGSTGASGRVTQPSYDARLLIATGSYIFDGSGLKFNPDMTNNQANVFVNGTDGGTEPAVILGIPEPATLGLVALNAAAILGRRRRERH